MDRKVFIIRTWLLLIALCGVTLAWPSVGIGVWPLLGMMISTYKCCCGDTCENCDEQHVGNMQIDIAGVVVGTTFPCTNCDVYNGSFELIQTAPCSYFLSLGEDITCAGTTSEATLGFGNENLIGPGFTGALTMGQAVSLSNRTFAIVHGAAKPDCTAYSATALSAFGTTATFPSNLCDITSATVTATAL